MREMLLAAAVCGALGLAVADLRMTGGDTRLSGPPSRDAEARAILSMMGAPYMVIDRNGAGARPRMQQGGGEGGD